MKKYIITVTVLTLIYLSLVIATLLKCMYVESKKANKIIEQQLEIESLKESIEILQKWV